MKRLFSTRLPMAESETTQLGEPVDWARETA